MASIKVTRPKLTVLVDESTSLSKKSCLIVYLRTSVDSSEPSPKNLRELDAEVGVCLRKIGRVLGIRWVASSFRTVNAVWTMYAALYHHLTSASVDVNRSSNDRCMYEGLAAKLTSVAFVKNLGLMMDALEELKDLLRLYSREILDCLNQ
ncbi:hypothetical protein F7725_028216 [Dissostichus mawsoni]|uniref:Uncharacterized protein n=1 Tax=Dissostichus mawsoni TaxID=36200 RepID=A0A7J5XHH1_DISMA|nr:hypothetical protein F7725_028216 [Dissostichus mawsoni]